jgi:hypothetical protein
LDPIKVTPRYRKYNKTVQTLWTTTQDVYPLSNKRYRILKGQSKPDNPEKLATQGTQDKEKHN